MRFVNRIFSKEEQARKDPRLQCLERRPLDPPFPNQGTEPFETNFGSSQDIARRDPERWAAATFVAGR